MREKKESGRDCYEGPSLTHNVFFFVFFYHFQARTHMQTHKQMQTLAKMHTHTHNIQYILIASVYHLVLSFEFSPL